MSLGYGGAQWEALAIRWVSGRMTDEQKGELSGQMSRIEQRRFAKLVAAADQKKLHHGDAYLTGRAFVVHMGAYTEQYLMPLAANLDAVTNRVNELDGLVAYLRLPFYRRWWVRLRVLARRFGEWSGIRVVSLTEEAVPDGDVTSGDRHGDGGDEAPGADVVARDERAHEHPAAGVPAGVAGDRDGRATDGDGVRDRRNDRFNVAEAEVREEEEGRVVHIDRRSR